ncbi:hypothetical protein PSP6_540064 [Paraburkholderia tropica]|nr:hypothetical protein PSP6_540064 [Paraburkholderia tropica]
MYHFISNYFDQPLGDPIGYSSGECFKHHKG